MDAGTEESDLSRSSRSQSKTMSSNIGEYVANSPTCENPPGAAFPGRGCLTSLSQQDVYKGNFEHNWHSLLLLLPTSYDALPDWKFNPECLPCCLTALNSLLNNENSKAPKHPEHPIEPWKHPPTSIRTVPPAYHCDLIAVLTSLCAATRSEVLPFPGH